MKCKIVKFANGTYGIRKGWMTPKYLCLATLRDKGFHYWWYDVKYIRWFSTPNLEDLESWVIDYNSKSGKMVEVIKTINLND